MVSFLTYTTTASVAFVPLLLLCHFLSDAFHQPMVFRSYQPQNRCPSFFPKKTPSLVTSETSSAGSSTSSTAQEVVNYSNNNQPIVSTEWELDCYSRPVVLPDGKKLWEVLLTDSTGTFYQLLLILFTTPEIVFQVFFHTNLPPLYVSFLFIFLYYNLSPLSVSFLFIFLFLFYTTCFILSSCKKEPCVYVRLCHPIGKHQHRNML
jgi:hypothetical protein